MARLSASEIAERLGGRRVGAEFVVRCLVHDDSTPSLYLRDRDGKVLVMCRAGCPQADVIEALRDRGLWPGRSGESTASRPRQVLDHVARIEEPAATARTSHALRIWERAAPLTGTVGERYLWSRAIALAVMPEDIRFCSGLQHECGRYYPALVALVRRGRDGVPIGIHRTFLRPDGRAKAPVEPQRMMLGPCAGGAVRCAPVVDGHVLVGEGVETVLSAMVATGRAAWAALSTSGLQALDLPSVVQHVTILADADPAGERAAAVAGRRWALEGRRVRIARPAFGDFNDSLVGGL